MENKVKIELESTGFKEGLDFWHNVRVKTDYGSYIWLDFYLPRKNTVIEVSPSIWHEMFGRRSSDLKKLDFLSRQNLSTIEVTEYNIKNREWLKDLSR
jgi:hypothetical protein